MEDTFMVDHNKPKTSSPSVPDSAALTRRDLLTGTGLAVGALSLTLSDAHPIRADHVNAQVEKQAPPFDFKGQPKRERRSFHDLTDEEVRLLCNAIGYMRDGSAKKPVQLDNSLQWDQYVSTHAQHCAGTGYQQVHWSWLFLPWHRAYLFFVERRLAHILTTVFETDGSKFALPYWDWEVHKEMPNTRLRKAANKPSPFFGINLDVDDLADPDPYNQGLWDSYRAPTIEKPEMDPKNEKGPIWKDHIAEAVAYTSPKYIESLLGFPFTAFAGRKTAEYPAGQGLLEMGPHNYIHDWVGSRYGANRDMGTLRYAGLDPVFYLHHAKVDEIWSRYAYQPDAASIQDWYRYWFNFRDVDGKLVSVTVKDTVENMTNVVYLRPTDVVRAPLNLPKGAPREQDVVVTQKPATLAVEPISLMPAEPSDQIKNVRAAGDNETVRSLLEFEVGGLSYAGRFSIRVFVNKPDANINTDIKDEHFLGTFGALDSHAGHAMKEKEASAVFVVNVSRQVSNFYKVAPPGKPFTLTLVPVGTPRGLHDFQLRVKSVKFKVFQ
jgi:polyphenol oxidase